MFQLHREAAVRNLRDCDFPSFIYPDIPLDELLSYNCVLGKNKDGSVRSPPSPLSNYFHLG